MIIVTLNSGSTSVKLGAFSATEGRLPEGVARERFSSEAAEPAALLSRFAHRFDTQRVAAVAHRVVHGGTRFTEPTLVDARVQSAIEELSALAPLHNPLALCWLTAAREHFGPQTAQIAAFDTAFFSRLPRVAGEYALPASLGTALGVRRYGFHGLAHQAMWRRWCERHPELEAGGRIITLQLGGGCSAAAIDRGRPIDTSMGFSPLEGLVMATRAGDIDAAVIPYLSNRLGCSSERVVDRLNHEAGLAGVSGTSSDMRALLKNSTPQARFAIDIYCYRIRKYLGAYIAALGGCDGIVIGGGVGEHVPEVRARIFESMQWLGAELAPAANVNARGGEARISADGSRITVEVIPGDEELSLALAALSCISAR